MSPPPRRRELLALALITVLAIACRLAALGQPMRYDEAVTWALFAGRSWTTIVTWYPFPNNHVLHSLLAKAAASLAPWSPWALRLPAFLAGVAIVPLTWAVGRRFAGIAAGLGGAALAAGSTSLVLYSTNARGYSLVGALSLGLVLVADRLRERPTAARWLAYALLAAAGLFTIPVMLYPFGAVSLWLSIDALQRPAPDRRARVAALAASCGAAAAIAGVCYLPIIRTSGLASLADNRFVAGSSWSSFVASLPRHVLQTLGTWTEPFPWWAVPIGLVLALFGGRRAEPRERPSLALATIAWSTVLLLATHRTPFVRVWLWMLPLYLVAVARGMETLVRRLAARAGSPGTSWESTGPVLLAAGVVALALGTGAAERTDDTGTFRGAREAAGLIAPRLRPGDRVLAPLPTNGPLLYYFAERGLDTASLNVPLAGARRAFMVLDPARGHSIDWAVRAHIIDPSQFAPPVLLGTVEGVEIWSAERRP
jgi:hypothetical protein